MSKIKQVVKRSGAVVPFKQERIANAIFRAAVAVGGRDRERANQLSDQVVEILEKITPEGTPPAVEDIQDIVEKVLIENGHAKVAKAYILYRAERQSRREIHKQLALFSTSGIPWRKVWYVLDWAVTHQLHTVESLNRRLANGEFKQIVAESEAMYKQDVDSAIELIGDRAKELRIVIITGPSSSGKTTTAAKLNEQLVKMGMKFATLNVDNYFYDLDMHPQDEFGDYDFETPQALDMTMVNEHIHRLLMGEEVLIPYYDFQSGQRINDQTPLRLSKDEVLLIDSLHGLYPAMTDGILPEQQFKLYLEPLLQLKDTRGEYVRWTDIRLMRRMLRDAEHRNWPMEHTLTHWHYVRASELRNIIPHIHTADYIVNTGMSYELPLYRGKMLDKFIEWEIKYEADPVRHDAFERANRVRRVLEQITGVEDDSAVPADSVVREFIGGSIYDH